MSRHKMKTRYEGLYNEWRIHMTRYKRYSKMNDLFINISRVALIYADHVTVCRHVRVHESESGTEGGWAAEGRWQLCGWWGCGSSGTGGAEWSSAGHQPRGAVGNVLPRLIMCLQSAQNLQSQIRHNNRSRTHGRRERAGITCPKLQIPLLEKKVRVRKGETCNRVVTSFVCLEVCSGVVVFFFQKLQSKLRHHFISWYNLVKSLKCTLEHDSWI